MTDFSSKWLVETDWLAERLKSPGLVVMDASLGSGGDVKTPREHYLEEHIPGALFFDIEDLSDETSTLPHMLPSPEKFSSRMRKMGVGDGMKIVVYDRKGIYSAPRAWWMFRIMGHEDVAVLNGGLPKWRAEGLPLESGEPAPRSERHFTARFNAGLVRDLADMSSAVARRHVQIADARAAARFAGREAELRPVPRLGDMPGALNVPFTTLLNANATMKGPEDVRAEFEKAGIDPDKPVIATCGSGVTACTLALGLAVIGNEHAAVYDGSWYEWSHEAGAPVATDAGAGAKSEAPAAG
jgi:thiosulfate/3-mercaptopyruvate sulfurtransferase